MALQRPVQLVEIAVVEAAPDRLPQLVLGHRVDAGAVDERGVVAVDDLGDEPRVGMRLADPGQHLRPERFRHRVGGVEPPAVGAAAQPVVHHVDGVVDDGRAAVVEGDELAVALEGVEAAGAAAEPADRLGVVVVDSAAVAAEIGSDMVEHAVEQHPQPPPVGFVDEVIEVGVVTQAWVDAVVIGGVVAVGAGGEDRAKRDSRGAEFDGVVEPVDDAAQPMFVRLRAVRRWGRRRRIPVGRGATRSRGAPSPARSWPELRCVEGHHLVAVPGAGPSTVSCGATVVIGSVATGGSGACQSVSHWASWAHRRPQIRCGPSQPMRVRPRTSGSVHRRCRRWRGRAASGDRWVTDHCAIASSGWAVASPPAT